MAVLIRARQAQSYREGEGAEPPTEFTLGVEPGPAQAGNIQDKMGVGTYEYGQGAGPHAVTRIGARQFYYDANGNLEEERRDGNFGVVRGFRYTGADQVRRVEVPGRSAVFHYGADRARVIRKDYDGTTLKSRTDYIGNVEVVRPVGGHAEYRRYIGGVVIATWYEQTGVSQERYLHKDHLGSTVAISDIQGSVHHLAYDPWGKRRDAHTSESWDVPPGEWLGWILAITPRGYTGHEHVDFAGIIHMNGRIYDPELGRFLQADPFVEDSTTLNRYTYVHNNPLAYVDPSGYMSAGQILRAAVAIAITVYTGGMASGAAWAPVLSSTAAKVAAVAIGGALAGAIQTGSIEGAAWGAFTALVFYGVGKQFGDVMDKGVIDTAKVMKKALAHGIAGGTLSSMQGGKFGHGFMSAGFSAAVSPYVDAQDVGDFAKGVQVALVGGTVSAATGGKFANGAVTAAMQFAFNQVAHRYERGPTRMCWTDQSGCTLDNALEATRPVSVPFTDNPVEGRMEIGPFNDPIEHVVDRENHTISNITLEGHTFHEGQVVHSLTVDTRLRFSFRQGFYRREGIFLTTTGTGSNACLMFCVNNATDNYVAGRILFLRTHYMAPRLMQQYLRAEP
ncbi:MAG TPA: RHS repeat-associated core domain-containing protein [Xanthomonadaceae bacterium]|nr:RHS repeat-associated core domain-containing protein [Xanthomonadaceae bacterium]